MMNILKFGCLASAFAAPLLALATNYSWTNTVGGTWSASSNWSPEGVPTTTSDYVTSVKAGTYAVKLGDGDVTIHTIKGVDFSTSGLVTFDLNGHKLWLVGSLQENVQDHPTEPGDATYTMGVVITNGTFQTGANILGTYYSQSWGLGILDVVDADWTGSVGTWNGASRVIIRGGATWTLTGGTRTEPGYYHSLVGQKYPAVIVSGPTSAIDSSKYDLTIGGWGGGLFVRDGATATYRNIKNGGTIRSTNTVVSVENGTLNVPGVLHVGTDFTNVTEGTIFSAKAVGKGASLSVRGAHALATIGDLRLYEKTAAHIDVLLPAGGFVDAVGAPRAPIVATNLSFVARNPEFDDFGPLRFRVACGEWANAKGPATATLLSLVEPDPEGLAKLIENVEWLDWPAKRAARGIAPTLAVSADGKSIVLTAPYLDLKPSVIVCGWPGTSAGKKRVRMLVCDYGLAGSSFVKMECTYADNPEFTGAVTKNLLGTSKISGSLPQSKAYDLDGDFVADKAYWAKLRLVNDSGYEQTIDFNFDGDGPAESYTWSQSEDGVWSDVANWTVGTQAVAAETAPHASDTVTLAWPTKAFTVSLTRDESLSKFTDFNASNPTKPRTIDMGGHTLTLTLTTYAVILDAGGTGGDNTNYCGSTLVFRNGNLMMPDASLKFAQSLGGAQTASGTLVLENRATLYAGVYFPANSSRLFVRDGSVFRTRANYEMASHTANTGYPRLLVSGEDSALEFVSSDASSRNLTVRGRYNALARFSEGASLKANNLAIGGSGTVNAGSVESQDTLAEFDDATAELSGDIKIGWTANLACAPRLRLAGTGTKVAAAGSLQIHEGLGATVEFAVPEDGFRFCPLNVADVAFVAKPDGNTDFGAKKLKLTGVKAWAKKHPEETQTLITLTTANAAALETLRQTATSDWHRVGTADLSVTADGKSLVLTAPPLTGLSVIVR